MKLRTKITLLTSLLLIGILLCVDIAVYSLFIKSATQNAGEMLLSKWEPVIEQGESMSTEAQDVLLYKSLTEDTLIRISIPGSDSVRTITNGADFDLNEVPVTDNRTKGTKLLQKDDERILMVYIPVETASGDMGGFEIAEKMDDLETNLKILVTILTSTTFGAVLLCMLGGSMLSRTVVRPITSSIRTMREIERSLAFMKISYKGKNRDELYEMTETFNRMMERLEESFWNQQ
ncbi:HAMP domain-containing protein [Paenibacillus sp. P46E]|uniref:HAMP domain-containing protein n=1 Tax=Paenibacillus sp. P46E TaxID=1349436 RepID=UPI000A6F157F|nr:HAMP domain-containing protein [Paenibacillus sp. P46E]